MDQDKSQSESVETASADAMRTEVVSMNGDGAARDERADAARPKQAGKRKGTGKAASGIGARSDQGKAKPPKTTARATGAAASKDKAEAGPATAGAPSKLDRLVTLLRTPGGATLPELQSATGWQVHSVRGAMAGALRKKGYSITSEKPEDGLRRYRIAEAS